MGGTIESLIGTLMTTSVHFLPGTTYSNVKQRGEYDSEKHSVLTFKEFCAWFAGQVLIYHGTVHSELRKSPKDAWEEFYSHKTMALPPMIINKRNLYIDFLPERHKPVRNSGITINAGVYYAPELAIKQGKGKITVKYDPNDMTHIWAKIHDDYIRVPLIRSTHNFINYEYYRVDRAFNQGRPAGTITDPEALQQLIKNNELVKKSKKKTQQKKRETTLTEAQRQHKDRFSSGVPKQILINDEYHQVLARQPNDAVNFSKPPALFDDKD
ncbi:hypothetical protein BI292_01270 [Pseudomonas sp. 43NM1]|nr:hypothetical protein BI292_01270 [Pseudomonas sp. 43NM1]